MPHIQRFLELAGEVCRSLDPVAIEDMALTLKRVRDNGGRLFILGVGGSAGNASHAVNDFRKLCGIEAYAPTDNVSELTARTNDEGWETVFREWLKTSRARAEDALLIFSVGGGDAECGVSMNLVHAIDLARERGMAICSVVGRDQGHAARHSTHAIIVPQVDPNLVTPISEAFQSVIWHALVSHPELQIAETTW
ncbi:SIS domain-containing protein [Nisaea sp.]|uniref:SIS domain-containing protein n=1 Tax=Nisaea sp. TaxID=2024842 RepID=UPI002B276F76|nr:SIS domain-containing protein [Nisaea sp.]